MSSIHALIRPRTCLLLLCLGLSVAGCKRRRPLESQQIPQTSPPSDWAPAVPPASIPPAALPVPLPSPSARLEDEGNTVAVFRALAPATVFVTQNVLVRDWTMRALEVPSGTGTGFVWDKQGNIVTNYHVIDQRQAGRATFTIALYNQKSYSAKLVGGEPRRDIAVLRIEAPEEELIPVQLPSPASKLEVGQKAIAIGNPFGLDHTLTTGVISAIGREVEGYGGVSIRDMVQTDASINPGNSGGPLLDSGGRLIGMNTMIYSKGGTSAGIGFAVPVATIRRIVPQIIQFGKAKHPGLGLRLLPDAYAARAGIRGVIVAETVPNGPAAAAGIRGLRQSSGGTIALGDVIVGINDIPVANYDDLYNTLDHFEAGQDVTVRILRDGRPTMLKLKLVEIE